MQAVTCGRQLPESYVLSVPRYQQLRRWEVSAGYRAGRWDAAGADQRGCAGREDTAARGKGGTQTRPCLMRAEHGNPDGVRAAGRRAAEETDQSKVWHRASGRPNRDDGKKHNTALICLVRRGCDVLRRAMLRNGTHYRSPELPSHPSRSLTTTYGPPAS